MALPRNTLPKEKATREVKVLFPRTTVELTPEAIRFYQSKRPFAFAFDRQSDHVELTRAEATGADRRVRLIEVTAKEKGLYLPQAVPQEARQNGDLPFIYDNAFWFVDGQRRRATGYAASQYARPRLWDGFLLAQALAAHQTGPACFIIGEATRFFRDEKWLMEFTYAIWEKGIELIVHPFGPVTRHTLQGLVAYVNALSGWLPMVTAGSRETRKNQKRPFSRKQPFGLRASGLTGEEPEETRIAIWTDPAPWNAFRAAVHALGRGEIRTCVDMTVQINAAGFKISHTRVQQLLASTIPEGVHLLYRNKVESRRLVQEGGLFSDLDITEGGNRRYLYQPQEAVPFTIRYTPGTLPIEPDILSAARSRVQGNRGRPLTASPRTADYGRPDYSQALLPTRLLRCAVCGHSLRLMPPRSGSNKTWTVVCNCVGTIRMKYKLSRPDARAWVEQNISHATYANVDLGERVWALVAKALEENPIAEPSKDAHAVWALREREARLILQERETAFRVFQKRCAGGEMGDLANRWVAQTVDAERAEHLERLEAAEREVSRLTTENLNAHKASVHYQSVSRIFATLAARADRQAKQQILVAIVQRVTVHLGEQWFEIQAYSDWSQLGALAERAHFGGTAENTTQRWTLDYFHLPLLRGSWAA